MNKLLLCFSLSFVTLIGTATSYATKPTVKKVKCYDPFAILTTGTPRDFNILNIAKKTLLGACSDCGASLTPPVTTTYLRDILVSNNDYSTVSVTKLAGSNKVDLLIGPGAGFEGHIKVTATKFGTTTDVYTALTASPNTWEYGFNDDCTIYFKEVASKKYLCVGGKFLNIQGADYDSIIAKKKLSASCSYFPYPI